MKKEKRFPRSIRRSLVKSTSKVAAIKRGTISDERAAMRVVFRVSRMVDGLKPVAGSPIDGKPVKGKLGTATMVSCISALKRGNRMARIKAGLRPENVADAHDEKLRVNGIGLTFGATTGYRLASDRRDEEVSGNANIPFVAFCYEKLCSLGMRKSAA